VQSAVWDGAVHGVTALAKNEAFNATGQLACAWSTTARRHSTECVHRRSMMEKSPCGGCRECGRGRREAARGVNKTEIHVIVSN
jgi:hypothetical protein